MKNHTLYLIIAVLAVALIVLGIYMWREQSKPEGVEIKIDEHGVSIQKN